MDTRFSKGTILARHLVRDVKNAPDTPSLISTLAGDRSLLQSALRVLNPTPSVDADFIEDVDQACRQTNLSLPELKRRLEPAAAALGISTRRDDPSPDFYDILDIPSSAGDSDIRNAYRSRAKTLHPDTNPEADSVDFVRLTEAYRVLSNPQLRGQYDARRRKRPYWVEKDATARKLNQRKILARRQRRRTFYQVAGLVVLLLAAIVVTDVFFKEQALREAPRVAKVPAHRASPGKPAPTVTPPDSPPGEQAAPPAQGDPPRSVEMTPPVLPQVQVALPADTPAPNATVVFSAADPVVKNPPAPPEPRMPPPLSDTPQESPGAPASRSTATDRVPDVDTPKVRAAVVPPSGNQEPEPLESPPVPVAPEPEPAASHSPERIEAFLASYCGAYQALNYDRFMGYFTPDAVENDQAVKDLEASYRHNFETLRDLAYRIDVDHVTVQGDRVDVTGDYVLRWRFRNTGWRKREGPIFLSLVQGDENYQVKRLVYR